jgi:hypothetical protein
MILSQRKIFWFWLPLAASWVLMNLEGPIIQAAIARLPEVNTMLAAAGIVFSLQITIESPVIMLLATSTALATSPQAYRALCRFVLVLTLLLTLLAAAIAFIGPIYNWLLLGIMGVPEPIAVAARPAMQLMILWSAAIGWRRFYQGILIRFGQTQRVGYGTAIRLSSGAITALTLTAFFQVSGVMVGACTWMAGVTSELIYACWAARPTVSRFLSGPSDPGQPPLSYHEIIRYHAPLAASSMLALLVQPLIGAGLARMAFAEENLAAWPVIFGLYLLFRSLGFALPEVVIALLKKPGDVLPIRRFCFNVAAVSTLVMALLAYTPLLELYLGYVAGITPELIRFIIPGVTLGILIPLLAGIQCWFRGLLMLVKATNDVYRGMGLNLGITALALFLGVISQAPGITASTIAFTLGMVAETLYLWWRVNPVQSRLRLAPQRSM